MLSVDASGKRTFEKTRFGERPETIALKIREPGSAITHFVGFIASAMAGIPLIMKTCETGSVPGVIGMIIFVLAACVLYAASSVYHTAVCSEKATTILRKFDHVSISVMIAGTYTPVCLTVLRDKGGIPLLVVIWVMAAAGIGLKLVWVSCPKWLSSAVYVVMGWACIFAVPSIYRAVGPVLTAWVVAGGIFYSAGAVIYAMHPVRFDAKHIYFGSHEIFHVFIMLGTLCHFVFMYGMTRLI